MINIGTISRFEGRGMTNIDLLTGLRAILHRIDDEGRTCNQRQDWRGYRAHRRDADMLPTLIRQVEQPRRERAA